MLGLTSTDTPGEVGVYSESVDTEVWRECVARHVTLMERHGAFMAHGGGSVLRSVSKSKRADLRGLAIISLKLAKANATHAKSRVKALLKEKLLSTYRKSCLQTCRELYSDAASSFRNSVKPIKSGRYADAKVYISSAVDAPGECEDSFQEGDITSPLTKVNYDLFQLAVIALAITSRLG
ncbi:hypothetical protein BHE74_00014577 [Ensete ventricosum]|nr:hypothetical protein BHE74_00014577 [Ensete ventricosum]